MPKEPEKKGALARASDIVKTAATNTVAEALAPEKVKRALALKLLVSGLTLVALAGGFDYFSHDDEIHKVISGFAREADYQGVAEAVESFDERVTDVKQSTLARVPTTIRDHLAGAALATGMILLGAGLRMKIKEHHPVHGKVLRDVGRAISGPGYVGVLVFMLLSWHGALIIRRSLASLFHKLSSGEISWKDAFELVGRYAPWAYEEASTVLWLGVFLGVVAIGAKITEPRVERFRIPLEVARRTASWGSVLSLVYFASAVVLAAASYGGALRVITWPWKVDPGAFLGALGFMSFGMGLDRTGTRMIKREDAKKGEEKKKK